jgi:hypothetical protein
MLIGLVFLSENAFDRLVQGVELIHLGDGPGSLFSVPSHLASLVAGLAQGYHGVVPVLLDVVGI